MVSYYDYFHILKLYLSMDKWKINEWKWKFESQRMTVPAASPICSILYHKIQISSDRVRTGAYEDNKMAMTVFPAFGSAQLLLSGSGYKRYLAWNRQALPWLLHHCKKEKGNAIFVWKWSCTIFQKGMITYNIICIYLNKRCWDRVVGIQIMLQAG